MQRAADDLAVNGRRIQPAARFDVIRDLACLHVVDELLQRRDRVTAPAADGYHRCAGGDFESGRGL